ncbi:MULTISPECIES: PTS sugar transporter subunit IIC [unclassified Granulicatella]|uniref:PTS mannose/fructose/sorbose/N-acetylgalactosamine transporter subunit IIC n=1 Tax=unclassified Granulicatella TaxID=2630493 RepID=UPI001073657D|nr:MULTISPECIES: PTS sugar transporter subunit IIC [unclassified Granulicatella]MBF0779955.1 PTS sugar transporter subunit IIC [Granulicatella sp. 19428wC4_WM01]TFU95971.1 PTS sugar transporter subunit IIC [Granulicatella sp. WM01]
MQIWQIVLLTLYSGYQILDELTIVSSAGSPVFAGFITGLIMGDLNVGLFIGGSLQLTVLGVGTFGGSSRIDATSGAVLATAFSIAIPDMKPEVALATIAVPVAALMVQTDVLGRFTTTYFAHRIDKHIEDFNYKGIERNYLLGALPWALSRALPVFLALSFGVNVVESVTKYMNSELPWLVQGLTVAGGALPGVGFAILLRYLPVKKHFPYLIAGFTITALFTTLFSYAGTLGNGVSKLFGALPKEVAEKVGAFGGVFTSLPILTIALIGFAIATLHFKKAIEAPKVVTASASTEGEIDDDEI